MHQRWGAGRTKTKYYQRENEIREREPEGEADIVRIITSPHCIYMSSIGVWCRSSSRSSRSIACVFLSVRSVCIHTHTHTGHWWTVLDNKRVGWPLVVVVVPWLAIIIRTDGLGYVFYFLIWATHQNVRAQLIDWPQDNGREKQQEPLRWTRCDAVGFV